MNLAFSKCYSHFHPVAIFEVYTDEHSKYFEVRGNLPEIINRKLETVINKLRSNEKKTISKACLKFFTEFKQNFRYDIELFYIPSAILNKSYDVERKAHYPFDHIRVKYFSGQFSTWKKNPLESYIIQVDLLTNRLYKKTKSKFKKISKNEFLTKVREYKISEEFGKYFVNNYNKPKSYCYYYSPTLQQDYLIGFTKNNRIMFTLHIKNLIRYKDQNAVI